MAYLNKKLTIVIYIITSQIYNALCQNVQYSEKTVITNISNEPASVRKISELSVSINNSNNGFDIQNTIFPHLLKIFQPLTLRARIENLTKFMNSKRAKRQGRIQQSSHKSREKYVDIQPHGFYQTSDIKHYQDWKSLQNGLPREIQRIEPNLPRVTLPTSDRLSVNSKKRSKRFHNNGAYHYHGSRKENVKLSKEGNADIGKYQMRRSEKTNQGFQPMGGMPLGPIADESQLRNNFRSHFSDNARENIPWEEPNTMSNCWGQSMLSARSGFSPSCNPDGSYSPKQCHLERCWCVYRDGTPRIREPERRFYYGMSALMLQC